MLLVVRYRVRTTAASSKVSMVSFTVRSLLLGNDFELIPMLKMESGQPVDGPLGREFSPVCNDAEQWRPEVASR